MGTGHQRGERAGHRPATRCGVLTSPIRVVEGVITGRLLRARQTGFKGKEVQAGLLTREPWSMSNSASRLGVGVIPRQQQLVMELRPIFNKQFKVPWTRALLADYDMFLLVTSKMRFTNNRLTSLRADIVRFN